MGLSIKKSFFEKPEEGRNRHFPYNNRLPDNGKRIVSSEKAVGPVRQVRQVGQVGQVRQVGQVGQVGQAGPGLINPLAC